MATGAILGVGVLMAGVSPPAAQAQTRIKPEATPTPPPSTGLRKHIQEVRNEPSAEVKDVPLDDSAARIDPARNLPGRPAERGVPAPEPDVTRPATVPELPEQASAKLFRNPQYKERFGDLKKCRNEVAFDRKVKPAAVVARGLLLRWTVNAEGRVQDVDVVSTGPTDPDVMTCVHKKLSAWQIDPVPAEPYRVSWKLNFR
jgi:hypothetical protein